MITAGAACLDITPPLGTMIPGSFEDRFAEKVRDPLHVRSFVVERGGEGVAIVVCDLIGVKRDYLDRAKERIAVETELSAERILICCTHTHTGAVTGDDAYTAFLIDRIADAVRLAWQERKPAQVGFGQTLEDRVVFNRRYRMRDGSVRTNPGVGNPDVVAPMGPIDPEIGVVCLQGVDGRAIGLLANYALHYIGVPESTYSISADYFGFFSTLIQRMRDDHFVAALSNGACGDINNIDVLGDRRPVKDRSLHAERVAGLIAAGVLWVWNEMDFASDVSLGAAMQEVVLKRKPKPSEADIARVREIENMARPTMAERAFVRRITRRMADVPDRVRTWVQALRIGDLGIAAVPGELLVELGLDLKARSPFSQTIVIELANDSVGYLPTRQSYEEGGYEPEASVFAPGCGEQIVDAALGLLEQLR